VTYLPAVSGPRAPHPAHLIVVLLLVLPWLWPFASGPTPSVLPQLVSLACGALFLLVCLAQPGNPGTLFAKALLVGALVSSMIGLLQYLGASPALVPWINVTGPGYAFGNLRQRNQLGSLLNIGLAVLVWSAWTRRLRGANHVGQDPDAGNRLACRIGSTVGGRSVLVVVLLASASAATASRTALVQMATLLALGLIWRRQAAPGTLPILGGAVLAYAMASALLPVLAGLDPFASGIAARFDSGEHNCESRIILWHNVLQLIAQKPWFGWGWGELDYAHFITLYPGARFCDILDNAHNLPLHLAVELGVPVAVTVCVLVAWLIWRACPWRETDADRQMAWAVLAMIGLHSLLEYPLWYGPFQITTLLAIWILWRTRPRLAGVGAAQSAAAPTPRAWHSMPAVVGTGAVLLLVTLAYAAWDYHRISQIYRAPALRAPAYRDNTLAKIQDSRLFANQVRFAALTLTPVSPGNALAVYNAAQALLHFSPEARVVEKVIDSAMLLGRDDEAADFMLRYRNAYPLAYAHWRKNRTQATELPRIRR
jgi:O-antigen ligase